MGKQQQYTKIKDAAYSAPSQIGNEQTLELVLQEKLGRGGNAFVEIACLEEKETNEKEGPRHQFIEPERATSKPAHTDTMQYNHPENAESAEQVKSMIPFFHEDKGIKKHTIGIILN
jgi:hypothetical protein